MAYSATNASFGHAWRNMVMEPPRRELKHLMDRGVEKGELLAGVDIDLALALLVGPMLYWKMFLARNLENPRVLAEDVVDAFWKAFSAKSPARRANRVSRENRTSRKG